MFRSLNLDSAAAHGPSVQRAPKNRTWQFSIKRAPSLVHHMVPGNVDPALNDIVRISCSLLPAFWADSDYPSVLNSLVHKMFFMLLLNICLKMSQKELDVSIWSGVFLPQLLIIMCWTVIRCHSAIEVVIARRACIKHHFLPLSLFICINFRIAFWRPTL